MYIERNTSSMVAVLDANHDASWQPSIARPIINQLTLKDHQDQVSETALVRACFVVPFSRSRRLTWSWLSPS